MARLARCPIKALETRKNMSYERISDAPKILYHYTKKDNIESILNDGKIKKFKDKECWFCTSVDDALRYMELTVMNEGNPYIDVNGLRKKFPAFIAEDFVVLELTPRFQNGDWVKWNQEYPPSTPLETQELLKEFSDLKIAFRGDFKFKANPQILEVSDLLHDMDQTMEQAQLGIQQL